MDLSDAWRELCVTVARDSILPEILGPKIDLWRDVVMMKQARWPRKALASGWRLLAIPSI